MPTNEERREVAARLRNWESFRETFRESPICAAIDILNVEGYLDWRGVCEQMADLIEPEPERTCGFRSRLTGPYCYACTECGKGMKPDWAYCPKCGAKVME